MAAYKNNGTGGNSDRKVYLNISNGKVIQEWKEKPKDEWVPEGYELKSRIISKGVNQGKERFFIEYDGISGELLDVNLEKTDTGNRMVFTIVDDGQTYILQLDMDNAYGEAFLLRMNNLNVTNPINFKPWSMDAGEWFNLTGKTIKGTKSGLTIYQGEAKINSFYTKEEPNGLPDLVQKTIKGEVKWNSDDRDNFLYEEFLKFVDKSKSALSGKPIVAAAKKEVLAVVAAGIEDAEILIDEDDLPF